MHTYSSNDFSRFYSTVFNTLTGASEAYPPYNIVDVDKDTRIVQLAVAGFSKDDIKVSFDRNLLKIEADKKVRPDVKYIHNGIALRKFVRGIAIMDNWNVDSAKVEDGILSVVLKFVPDDRSLNYITVE
jgi:molecular chaperone IbpA